MFLTTLRGLRARAIVVSVAITLIGTAFLCTPADGSEKTTFSIETDPATFLLEGYAAHLRISPAGLERWRFGLGAYSMKLPDVAVDMNPDNKDNGWDVQLRRGYGFFTEYYFNSEQSGWLLSGQVAAQSFRLKNDETGSEHADYTNLLLMAQGGYRWFPTAGKVYVQPWMGLGYTTKVSGESKLGTQQFDIAPLLPFLTVHVGYQF